MLHGTRETATAPARTLSTATRDIALTADFYMAIRRAQSAACADQRKIGGVQCARSASGLAADQIRLTSWRMPREVFFGRFGSPRISHGDPSIRSAADLW